MAIGGWSAIGGRARISEGAVAAGFDAIQGSEIVQCPAKHLPDVCLREFLDELDVSWLFVASEVLPETGMEELAGLTSRMPTPPRLTRVFGCQDSSYSRQLPTFASFQLELPAENWKRQQQSLSRGSDRVDHFVIQEFHGERSPRTRQRGDRGCIVDDKHFSAVRAELLRQS